MPKLKNAEPYKITVASTGASGSEFLRQLLHSLDADPHVCLINLIVSDNALRVMAEEIGISGRSNLGEQLLGKAAQKVQLQSNADIGANVASGRHPASAVIVIPCSVGTLGRIASGWSNALIERAADVCLKQQKP